MPSTYNGSAAGITAHQQVAASLPVDGDGRNAESVDTPMRSLANFLQYLMTNAVLRGAIETALLNGGAGDTSAAIKMDAAVTARKLILELGPAGAAKTRLYQVVSAGFEISSNASWTGTQWARDVAGDAWSLTVDPTNGVQFLFYLAAFASPWNSASWATKFKFDTTTGMSLINRGLKTTGTDYSDAGANPGNAVAIANELRAKNICKVWATISCISQAIREGFNCTVSAVSSTEMQVTFAQAFAGAYPFYSVGHSVYNTQSSLVIFEITEKTYAGFKFKLRKPDGSYFVMTGAPGVLDVDIQVYGRQDT